MSHPPVGFESHAPERRGRSGTTLYGCGCTTCCCCCCLHTVGALIGAAIAPTIGSGQPPSLFYYEDEEASLAPTLPPATGMKSIDSAIRSGNSRPTVRIETDEDRPSVSRPASSGVSAVALFWWIVVLLSIGGMLVGAGQNGAVAILTTVLILALGLPAVQLGSAFLVLLILLFSGRADRGYQLKQLGKIALGTIIGTVAGILIMVAIGMAMSK